MSNQEPQQPQQWPTYPPPPPPRYNSPFPSIRTPNPHSPSSSLEPPLKRQRLSPNPPSPYASNMNSPNIANASLPRVHSPLQQVQQQPWNQPQPSQQYRSQPPVKKEEVDDTKIMGPPTKPEKAPDAQMLNDLVYASGIDLNEEERYLAETYRNANSFTSTSFNSKTSSTISPNNSFNNLWNPSFVGQNTLQPPGYQPQAPQLQPPPPKTPEDIENERHKAAARRLAEVQQQHLSDPFLQLAALRRIMSRRTYEYGITFDVKGLFDPSGPRTNPQGERLNSYLEGITPLGDMFALISLATNVRCGDLLEDAYEVARGRQTSSDGAIPPEWSDIAAPIPQSQEIIATLKAIAREDRIREEARIKKREQRAAAARASASASETPAENLIAPEVKISKKERDRINKAGQTDEVLHQNANTTMKQFLGTKTYSWMSAGTSTPSFGGSRMSSGTSTPRPPAGLGGGGAGRPGGGGGGAQNAALVAKQNGLGEWREDGEKGRGIQIRDWISVLERDGREKKCLAKAYVILLDKDQARSS